MQYIPLRLWLFASLALVAVLGCVSPPDYPVEPVIQYEGISKEAIYAYNDTTSRQDSVIIQFSFTDGDGDISSMDSTDIFIKDSRFPTLPPTIVGAFPPIPSEGTGNGISGDVFFTIVNSGQGVCCIFNDRICAQSEVYPVDTVSYEIFILDQAGNQSNVIRTEQIQILCFD